MASRLSSAEDTCGKIDGYDWEWSLIDTINVTDTFTFPVIVGCIDECNVLIRDDTHGRNHTYMFDMNTKRSQRVITGSDISWVTFCALLSDDKVVAGKARQDCGDIYIGEALTGCISVYDREWKLINDVSIRRNTTGIFTMVDVAVDQDGMIVVSEAGQSKIYIKNPVSFKIMNTITCKQDIWMRGVLSSGHIITQPVPPDHRVFIIDREGAQREITHSDEVRNACIDPMTDELYVVASYDEFKTCVIDLVMSGGDMKKKRAVSFPLSTKRIEKEYRQLFLGSSHVLMTSAGKMIACDGANILIFKKVFNH